MTDSLLSIGRVFTPLDWAKWLIIESGALRAWEQGAEILDPTCGDGAFLEAFIALGSKKDPNSLQDSASRLFGIEINTDDKNTFLKRIWEKYSIEFPASNFICCDILEDRATKVVDFIVGNPPWSNFSDLPPSAKDRWAKHFITHGLVKSKKDVLLGKSRADLCALVIKKCIDINLRPHGRASFFAPLSILFNDGANDRMRPYPSSRHGYAIESVWDLEGQDIFDGVATRYGVIDFFKSRDQTWPVRTMVMQNGAWRKTLSTSSDRKSGGWIRHETNGFLASAPRIIARPANKPRQGVNTGGANDVFVLSKSGSTFIESGGCAVDIERELLFPLMQKSQFSGESVNVENALKWIIVPHDSRSGRPLSWSELARYPNAMKYLSRHQDTLKSRKGVLIGSNISKGIWWSLLGVGSYSFSLWKVAWESLGKKAFRPVLLDGTWQGNQAMHAYCPCDTKEEAEALLEALKAKEIEGWLKSFSMDGTCNWAQPGKVARIFNFELEQLSLI